MSRILLALLLGATVSVVLFILLAIPLKKWEHEKRLIDNQQ